jgi:hypothetical protein
VRFQRRGCVLCAPHSYPDRTLIGWEGEEREGREWRGSEGMDVGGIGDSGIQCSQIQCRVAQERGK